MAQRTIKLHEDTFWELKRQALESRLTIVKYIDLLVQSENLRRRVADKLVDSPCEYHLVNSEPVYGPGSGYEPWQPACTCDNPCTYDPDRPEQPITTDDTGRYVKAAK